MGLFSVITKRGVGSLVLELTEMLHEAFSDTASCFSYVGGTVVGAVVAGDFVDDVFCVALSCQPCFAGVAVRLPAGHGGGSRADLVRMLAKVLPLFHATRIEGASRI